MSYQRQGFANGEVLTAEHLIAMEDAIIDLTPTSRKYTTEECFQAFVAEMNAKAKWIGTKDTKFNDASGRTNTSTAYDMLKIFFHASGYEKLNDICLE